MKWYVVIGCMLVAMGLQAASLEQAQRLQQLGYYAGAESVYRELYNNPDTYSPEVTKGLLQTLLLGQRTEAVQATLNSKAVETLTPAQLTLYSTLLRLQQGLPWLAKPIAQDGLDTTEQNWAIYLAGLREVSLGEYKRAKEVWAAIPPQDPAWLWTMAASTTDINSAPKDLARHLGRLDTQDWPLVRSTLVALISRGSGAQARQYIQKNKSRLPKSESELIEALSYPAKTPERAQALLTVIPELETPVLTCVAVNLALNEPGLAPEDIEKALGAGVGDIRVATLLAQAWVAQGAKMRAYEILNKAAVDNSLVLEWRVAYYTTLAQLALEQSPPRYREAAIALRKYRDTPGINAEEIVKVQEQIADVLYSNKDYADAAASYEKVGPVGYNKAVLAWIKAEKPEEAKRLLDSDWPRWSEAMLAYLMDVRVRGGQVEEAYAPWAGRSLAIDKRWPIEYLRIDSLAATDPQKALERIAALESDLPENAPYRGYFELQNYRLLNKIGDTTKAEEYLQEALSKNAISQEFAQVALRRAIAQRQPEAALELLPKIGPLPTPDRVDLMLMVADSLGNTTSALEQVRVAIEALPVANRPQKLIALARQWALVGRLDKASAIGEALLESALDGPLRLEAEFLMASLAQQKGDPAAEAILIGLSQREGTDLKQRALIRLAAYYAQTGRPKEAAIIFDTNLAELTRGPLGPDLQPHKEEILKCMLAIANALPLGDGATLRDWVNEQTTLSLSVDE